MLRHYEMYWQNKRGENFSDYYRYRSREEAKASILERCPDAVKIRIRLAKK